MPVTLIRSSWSSGDLIFHESASVAPSTTYNVLRIGDDAVQVGDTANDIDFLWYGTTTGTFALDANAHTLAMTGVATSTDGALTITNATATSSTTTGALIVTGGIATAADITVGDDIFLAATSVINFGAGDITFTGGTNVVTIAGGLLTSTNTTGFSSTATFIPDSTRTNYALAVGSRVTELDVTMAASTSQNFDPIQINLNIIGSAPTSTSTLNGIYQQITHDTTAMANIRVKGGDWTVTIGQNATDAYVYQGELQHTATATLSGESICMSALTNLSASVTVTADRVCAFQAMINNDGAAATVTGDCFVAYIVNAGTCVTTDSIVNIRNQSAATATSAMEMELDGTITYAIDFQGTVSDGWTSGDGAITASADEYVKIPVRVAGVTPTLYLLASETWTGG